ncbi:MAG: hypothetical protein R2705_07665 [Ilumatobacteraceae bacterium]
MAASETPTDLAGGRASASTAAAIVLWACAIWSMIELIAATESGSPDIALDRSRPGRR